MLTPKGKNSTVSTEELFIERRFYKFFIRSFLDSVPEGEKIPFCDLVGKNKFYGLIDKNNSIILPNKQYLVKVTSANNQEQKLQDFVAEAFNDLRDYMKSAVASGKLPSDSPYANLKVYKSYFDPDIDVISNSVIYVDQFKKQVISDIKLNSSIKNYKDFTTHFIYFLKNKIKNGSPVTRSGIITNNYLSNFSSGLIFDISKDKVDDDEIKFNDYLNINDFNIFRSACIKFGFFIDANVPWRLVADLESPAMVKSSYDNNDENRHIGYMKRNNIDNSSDLFYKRYTSTVYEEIIYFKRMFYDSYVYFLKDNEYYNEDYSKLCKRKMAEPNILVRDEVTKQKYYEDFPDTFWLRLFVYFRNYETRKNLSQQQFENIVREANNYVKCNKMFIALSYVENYFKDFTSPIPSDIKNEIYF